MGKKRTRSKALGVALRVGIPIAIIAIIFAIVYYAELPALSIRSGGMWAFCIIAWVLFAAIEFVVQYIYTDENGKCDVVVKWSVITVSVALAFTTIVGFVISGKMLNADKYRNLAQVENGDFKSDFSDMSQEDLPLAIVDVATARKLGDRTIGNIPNSAWYEVEDEYNLIKYQGEFYRVASLEYGGFLKYNQANDVGLTGFVLVHAETSEARFVEVEGGYFYAPSAYFGKDLRRHLRSQYPNEVFGQSFFEIDEEGNPYWITAVKTATIGIWGGKVENTFIITDAKNGNSNMYKAGDLPDWVDHAYDLSYLMGKADDYYALANGYWNSWFSKTGVYDTTYEYATEAGFEGYNSIVVDGEVLFFTGLTPANSAESNIGFILLNPKTGKITQYDCSGAEESSAQTAAEGLVQNLGYTATFPIVVNLAGEETYLICLKDKAGLIQRYALCNIENYSIVVESETLEAAISEYQAKLGVTENVVENTAESLTKTIVVEEVFQANIEGTTYFYYVSNGKIFKASITICEKQVIVRSGDKVKITYVEKDDICDIQMLEIS